MFAGALQLSLFMDTGCSEDGTLHDTILVSSGSVTAQDGAHESDIGICKHPQSFINPLHFYFVL